ncbi:hypothetical protein BCR42DRAFT_401403 [Absidia repens]|uniref:FAD/NAD(P)-binding domain-containing protein n=1 Tax=Absidia repens TaxID=90262 RepID=A0A1X2J448_9FUNG|nr:hypothetical protein BCR42DRAFT_401403 [Absidia repens]
MSYILPTIRRVAVIGAGPGGLAAAKQLQEEGVFDKISVFDRNDQIGGTWIYSSEQNTNPPIPSVNALQVDPPLSLQHSKNDDNSIPAFSNLRSAIYDGLRTNLPTSVMCYRDFDFGSDVPFFPSHANVLTYLQQFTQHFNLEPLIHLGTKVVNAEYSDDDSNGITNKEWTLTLQTKDKVYKETFDAVVVANGHYSIPYIPALDGIEALQNNNVDWIHSREYRIPGGYKDQTVIVIGSGSSGLDIVREVSKVAKKVYHCVRSDNKQSRQAHALDASNVERVGVVNRILADGAFECGGGAGGDEQSTATITLVDVDRVIFATGYLYSFPFFPFEQDNLIAHGGQSVNSLHEFLFYVKNPTLAFIGLPIRIVPLPLSQSQATVIARLWNPHRSAVTLPSQASMESTLEKKRQAQQQNTSSSSSSSSTTHQSFVLNVETECAYVDRLSAWAEGYREGNATPAQLDAWRNTSTDPLTCPLSEKWKQERTDALLLRKEYLGY